MSVLVNPADEWRKAQPSAIHPTWNDEAAWRASGESAAAAIVEQVRNHAGPVESLSILDYGCGAGRLSVPLADRFAKVHAVDTNAGYLFDDRFASKPNIQRDLITDPNDPGRSLDLVDAIPVDVVLCHNLMIHFDWPLGGRMLRRFADWSNMLVVIQLPLYSVPRRPEHWTGVGVWTLPMLEAAAGAAGLELVEWHSNPGEFTYDRPGRNHRRNHVLRVI